MLYSPIYVSTAKSLFVREELLDLLVKSNQRNAKLAITGLLLYCDGNFMQCLEGPKESIDTLMTSIYADSRHTGILVLWEDGIEQREFPEWAMAARSPDPSLRALMPSETIENWFKNSTQGKKSSARVLLEGFWNTVDTNGADH
jgi:hypothetical protein